LKESLAILEREYTAANIAGLDGRAEFFENALVDAGGLCCARGRGKKGKKDPKKFGGPAAVLCNTIKGYEGFTRI